ncbi:DMT family transporter [Serinibacter salmoneus]|uniref:Small multidrug resistance pump n=1 Tax=Serinibacter salmoneus TaxID=556530 RepID=A0A2A9D2K1_9MICO|nr:small multidrug resistance pump [Serinibacter salmoneus]
MNRWLALIGAVVSEVSATLALRAALDQPLWYVLVVVGYIGAFTLLTLAMRAGLALGVAYGVWASLGVALTAILSHLVFGEALTGTMVIGLVLIIGGVLLIELGSQRARDREAAAAGAGVSEEPGASALPGEIPAGAAGRHAGTSTGELPVVSEPAVTEPAMTDDEGRVR